ncbi:hypothetical protein [Fibrella aquatilis]|uniref:Uncharacterized protein n=1 Tax=Fibrella aquatilis TaxID=2817059 RepID=A0A939GB85_9BACT|nr:hypothetical protein [Fibrella aquatilis]MBO0933198.1 hypothetical protein [Fibrella aquatilis]
MHLLLVSTLISSLYGSLPTNQHQPHDTTGQRSTQSVQVQLGTTGARLYYYHSLGKAQRVSLRLGAHYLAYQKPFNVAIDKTSSITIRPDLRINATEVSLKWQVFPRRSLYLTGGISYNWRPSLGFMLNTSSDLNLSGLVLKADDIGTVNINFTWQSVMPYAGIGFGRIRTRRRFSTGLELGVFYLGKPTVTLDSDGALNNTTLADQLPAINRNLSGYRYLPSLNVTLTYQLNRPN